MIASIIALYFTGMIVMYCAIYRTQYLNSSQYYMDSSSKKEHRFFGSVLWPGYLVILIFTKGISAFFSTLQKIALIGVEK